MGIVVPETCWASNKICNKNLCWYHNYFGYLGYLVTIFNVGPHFTIHVEISTFAVAIMVTSVSVLLVYLA